MLTKIYLCAIIAYEKRNVIQVKLQNIMKSHKKTRGGSLGFFCHYLIVRGSCRLLLLPAVQPLADTVIKEICDDSRDNREKKGKQKTTEHY